jgi:hypothetical protein
MIFVVLNLVFPKVRTGQSTGMYQPVNHRLFNYVYKG